METTPSMEQVWQTPIMTGFFCKREEIFRTNGDMSFDGTQYIIAPPIAGPVISYSYVFKAQIDPTLTNYFQLSSLLKVKYLPGGTLHFDLSGVTLDSSCGPVVGKFLLTQPTPSTSFPSPSSSNPPLSPSCLSSSTVLSVYPITLLSPFLPSSPLS